MHIGDLMAESGVKFGTSGARGLASEMTDWVSYAYTVGFLRYLQEVGVLVAGQAVGIAGDLRPSTPRIMAACAQAVLDQGCRPVNFGFIPSPALAANGIAHGIPSLMVTGSHIPDDRNGIKFNLPTGEILKQDEEGIREQEVKRPHGLFDAAGAFIDANAARLPPREDSAYRDYIARYLDFFPSGCLAGLRVGIYEHSSVAREAYADVLGGLGAEIVRLARSEQFVPVDTEAIRPEDIDLARQWATNDRFDALVSADGDGDRPLIGDEQGIWLRGDIAGVLCARQLGATGVVTPVSSNTAVEKCGCFQSVLRTRIGSPFVIEGMQTLIDRGLSPVVGYEANGGFLLASPIEIDGRRLAPLPTRDAVLVAVTILQASVEQGKPLSDLASDLPRRFTYSDRLKDFPTHISQARIATLVSGDFPQDKVAIEALFGESFGSVVSTDVTDGLRITFASGEIAHLRPSGNAPELRAYTEADSPERARDMNATCMDILASWRR
ncbi:phosphoglucomutase/phosphomannomutase alpha/beta/alpha domain I [Thiorhodococcus drewsii AZ1]|uniref:Phosphoglucomutase/phosphomannomutase alpha/beta/alpha domain I n=1 Tax=Thiorhodococcus drewsii AZ1 TaxID=765913 RepID=G2E255_9GAMM|nr:phosphomannomutase [Thiorhodococcus drewsii]EGV31004.1 phosphoglucomutase/phosphomannomutase alpha/beta/alpha domain I [Thiorhodococcus drewsii AZ1]